MIYNTFWIPGKVPSLNQLMDFKAVTKRSTPGIIMRRGKSAGTYKFNKYNEVKKQWAETVRLAVIQQGFKDVVSCYFTYLFVEENKKRDPSNFCSAGVKFIEDGIVLAGVMPNDGWGNVLGISNYWTQDKDNVGILVAMSDDSLDRLDMLDLLKTYGP